MSALRRYVNQLSERENIDQVFLVADKQLRANRNGNLYLQLRLTDKTGSLTGMLWNASDGIFNSVETGNYLRVAGTTQVYNGQLQMIYNFNRPAVPLIHFVTWAVIITASAQLIFLFNFIWSLFKGERAGDNPWEATTLEWTTATPPPHDNFAGKVPTVYRGAYEYSVPGAPDDYVMQTTPDETDANVAGVAGAHTAQGKGDGHNGHG